VVKQVAGPVQQSGVIDFRLGMDAFFVEARESCRRGNTVKAVTVIKEAKLHLPVIVGAVEKNKSGRGACPR
jgi:hypothetical protein